MSKLLFVFIILNVANVIIQTAKSLITLKGTPIVAALSNAVAYGLYTIVLVYMTCDLPLWEKAIIVAICNLIGVYIVKVLEVKGRKDKLWKIEVTSEEDSLFENLLVSKDIPYIKTLTSYDKKYVYSVFCKTKNETSLVTNISKELGNKYFITESRK